MSSKKPTDTRRVRVSRGCCTLGWGIQLTLYAILVGRLDLCQDYFIRKGSEDGQPKDDYDIGSKASNNKRIQYGWTHLYTRENRPHI
jgi:hypothetical protein